MFNFKKFSSDPVVTILLLAGLGLRLLAAFLPDFRIDTAGWFAWSIRLFLLGPANFYSDSYWTHYTPGYLYILWLQGWLANLLQLNTFSYYYFLKLPTIFTELGLAYLAYRIVIKVNKKMALVAMSLILFNPAFILNSAVWGQVDGFLALFLLFTIYYLEKRNFILSALMYALAFLIKPQAIALLPALGLFWLDNFSFMKLLKFGLIFLLTVGFLSWPFYPTGPFQGLIGMTGKMTTDYPYTSLNAFNLWGFFGAWIKDSTKFGPLSYQQVGLILVLLYWIVISIIHFRKHLNLYTLSALGCLSFFFLPTRVHERYLYPALVFLAIVVCFKKSTPIRILFGLLVVFHFINLYFVYLISDNTKVVALPNFYNLVYANFSFLSTLATVTFLYLTYFLINA